MAKHGHTYSSTRTDLYGRKLVEQKLWLLSLLVFAAGFSGCRSKLSVTATGGASSAGAQSSFKVTGTNKVVTTPGETLTLFGQNFRSTMALDQVAGQNLAGPSLASQSGVSPVLAVQSGSVATVGLPVSQPYGPYTLALSQDGATQNVGLFSNGGKTDVPVFTGTADQMCAGQSFYDISGVLQGGTKVCTATSAGTTVPACTGDGATGCLATSPYVAALTTGLASKVVSGQTVAGVAGSVILPAASQVLTAVTYGASGTAATGTLTLPTAGNVLSGSGVFGVGGSSVTPALTLPAAANVRTTNGTYGVSGSGSTPMLGNCSADGATGCVAVAGYPAANTSTFAAANIQSGYTVAGVAGSAVIPSACTADGQQNCAVSGVFKAANVTGIGAWDLRAGQTIAGIAGGLKTNCRNTINSAKFNHDTLGTLGTAADISGTLNDPWDTVDDYYGWSTTTVTGWSSNTYCDSSTFTDVTTTDGGATAVACGTSSTCIYKDQVTNLQVTGILTAGGNTTNTAAPALMNWPTAVQTCIASTYGGYNAGTWRLPTQKEMMSLYEHGVASLASANFISLTNMQTNYFSASSIGATGTTYSWVTLLADGTTANRVRSNNSYVICVK